MSNDYEKAVEADRCMARIVQVVDISPIEGATNIELATVLGWQCVVKKDEFKIGDHAIYFCIDSVLDPNCANFQFLEGKRLKSRKIFGTLSQGLLGPLNWLSDYDNTIDISTIKFDDDVTKLLNVKKYVAPSEQSIYEDSDNKGNKTAKAVDPATVFPGHLVPKTDEERIQNVPKLINGLENCQAVITRKEDGTSATYVFNNGEFIVCSRNFRVFREQQNSDNYFKVLDRFDIEKKMREYGMNIAIQGEIVGPKINGNKMKLQDYDFRVFNIWDIDNKRYFNWEMVEQITDIMGLHRVPVVFHGVLPTELANVKALLELAEKTEYGKGIPAEGIVIKTNYSYELPRQSFKAISNKYLLKNN